MKAYLPMLVARTFLPRARQTAQRKIRFDIKNICLLRGNVVISLQCVNNV